MNRIRKVLSILSILPIEFLVLPFRSAPVVP